MESDFVEQEVRNIFVVIILRFKTCIAAFLGCACVCFHSLFFGVLKNC